MASCHAACHDESEWWSPMPWTHSTRTGLLVMNPPTGSAPLLEPGEHDFAELAGMAFLAHWPWVARGVIPLEEEDAVVDVRREDSPDKRRQLQRCVLDEAEGRSLDACRGGGERQ